MGKQQKLKELRRAAAAAPPPPAVNFSELTQEEKDAVLQELDRLPQNQKQRLIDTLRQGRTPALYIPNRSIT